MVQIFVSAYLCLIELICHNFPIISIIAVVPRQCAGSMMLSYHIHLCATLLMQWTTDVHLLELANLSKTSPHDYIIVIIHII